MDPSVTKNAPVYRKNAPLCFWKQALWRGWKSDVCCAVFHNTWENKVQTSSASLIFQIIVVINTFFIMLKVNFYVIGCSNSTYKIKKMEERNFHRIQPWSWRKKEREIECKPPFHLHIFLCPIKCKQLREAWIKAVKREPFDKKGSWQLAASDWVCSIHFVDGLATDENSIPTLFLGYESKEKKWRRTLFRKLLEKKWG